MQSTDFKYFTANKKGHPRERFNTGVLRTHAEFLVWKPEGRRPLGKPGPRCKADMKIDLKEAG
jgi:hypothetical protein